MLRQVIGRSAPRLSGRITHAGPSNPAQAIPSALMDRPFARSLNNPSRRCYAAASGPVTLPRSQVLQENTSTSRQRPNKTLVGSARPPAASAKATKRRRANASQAIRNDLSSPTRGPVLQCIAYSTAVQYDLEALEAELRAQGIPWDTVMPGGGEDQAIVVSSWGENSPSAARDREGAVFSSYGRIQEGGQADSDPTSDASNHDSAFTPFIQSSNFSSSSSPFSSSYSSPSALSFGHGSAGEIWIFRNGSYVTWGLNSLEGKAFLWEVVRGGKGEIEKGRLDGEVETEEVEFVVDEDAETTIKGNLILLGRPPTLSTLPPGPTYASLLTRYTLSLSLARSAALSSLESKLDAHLESVAKLPETLATWGKQPLSRKEVIRKIGELMMLREAVNFRGGGLEDTPEIYWSEPQLEEYFDAVSTEFEMKERIDAINQKIDYASEVQSTLRALLTEASGHRMELIIIALIAVEVVIVLIREGPELFHKFVDILPTIRTPSSLAGGSLFDREETPARDVGLEGASPSYKSSSRPRNEAGSPKNDRHLI